MRLAAAVPLGAVLCIVSCIVSCTASAARAADADVPQRRRVLVLEPKAAPTDRALAQALAQQAAAALDDREELMVIGMDELQKAMELESTKQEVGCDAASCAAELADALGAELVVFGDIHRVDSLIVVGMQLYDARNATLVDRAIVKAHTREEALDKTTRAVVAMFPGADVPVVAIVSVVGAGVGLAAVVSGGVVWAAGNAVIGDPKSSGSDKDDALARQPVGVAVLIGGGVVTAAALVGLGAGLLLAE
jgi:hypothetical protein